MFYLLHNSKKIFESSDRNKLEKLLTSLKQSQPEETFIISSVNHEENVFYMSYLKRAFFCSFNIKYNNLIEALKDIPNDIINLAYSIERAEVNGMLNLGYTENSGFSFSKEKAKNIISEMRL